MSLGRKEDNFKVNLHNVKKDGLIDEKNEGKMKLLGLKVKRLKAVKDMLGETLGVRTWLIESGKVYSGKKLFQEIVMLKIGSSVKICNPYCGTRILDLLSEIKHVQDFSLDSNNQAERKVPKRTWRKNSQV